MLGRSCSHIRDFESAEILAFTEVDTLNDLNERSSNESTCIDRLLFAN